MYYWLSFCDPDKPKGEQFLGGCIVEAPDLHSAIPMSWILGCNPGGEVQIVEMSPDIVNPRMWEVIKSHVGVLYSKQDMIDMGWEPVKTSELLGEN